VSISTIEALRAEVEYLREQLSGLTGTEDQITRIRTATGVRPKHARILALLLNTDRLISAETIYAHVFEHDNGDGPILKSVPVAICEIRKHIVPLGAPERCIPAAFGTGGYSLSPEARAWLNARLQPQAVAA